MGGKSNARKKRQQSGSDGIAKKSTIEFGGQVKRDVSGCNDWADKKVGGRKLAFDRAADVWGESGLSSDSRRVKICKSCYRTWKKAKKDEPTEWS